MSGSGRDPTDGGVLSESHRRDASRGHDPRAGGIPPWAELPAWALLALVTLWSRFAGLGERVMGHDESLHAYYSYLTSLGRVFEHDPVMHGPLLFHLNAVVFRLFGHGDAIARWTPAAAGVGVVLMIFPYRRWLGRTGALVAASLLAISPAFLFYSRYLRNDVYVALFALVWIYSLLRYLEEPRRVWLLGLTLAMAASFAAKETSFILGALIGSFLLARGALRRRRGIEPFRGSAGGDLAGLMLVLVLPFAAPVLHLLLGWDQLDTASPTGLRHAAVAATATGVAGLAVAVLWFRTGPRHDGVGRTCGPRLVLGLALLFWSCQILLFTSFLRNPGPGLASGIVGSLGYWIEQHEVARGSQPWFYYLVLGALYELLPNLLAATGAWSLLRRHRTRLAVASRAPSDPLPDLAAWWWLGSWLAYSLAGEKMPWLLVHMTLPACLLAGWWLGRSIELVDWRRRSGSRFRVALLAAPTLYAVCVAGMVSLEPFRGRDLAAVATSARWLFWFLSTIAVLLLAALAWRGLGSRRAARPLAFGVAVVLAILTARSAHLAARRHHDLPVEPLAYAQGTTDVRLVLDEIERLAERSGLGDELRVAFDDQTAWPFTWYFRGRPATLYYDDAPGPALAEAHVVLAGLENATAVQRVLGGSFTRRNRRLVWWPLETYRETPLAKLKAALASPAGRRRLWAFLWHRDPALDLDAWPYVDTFLVWTRRELRAEPGPPAQR